MTEPKREKIIKVRVSPEELATLQMHSTRTELARWMRETCLNPGQTDLVRDLRGAGYRSPIAGVAFTIGALSMVGFPFLGGFISKLNFGTAAMEMSEIKTLLVLVTLAISTWLNTVYFLRTVITLYRPALPDAHYSVEKGKRGFCFSLSCVAFAAVNVALGILSQPIVNAIAKGLSMFA